MKILRLLGVMAFAVLAPVLAFAQTVAEKTIDTTIEIPVSSWLTSAGEFVGPLLAAVVLWLIRKLPGQLADVLKTMRVDQLLQKAVQYGLNATAGAMKGKPLSINVGSEVVENALQYVIDNGPGWLISWMGGEDVIRKKIIARIELDQQAALK